MNPIPFIVGFALAAFAYLVGGPRAALWAAAGWASAVAVVSVLTSR